ncbi:glutathionylspermidine synthase [Dictyobacter sp. S3.2.2.5]|uniref:Glutathionylspermidine synthase n=1 Tax=Dictyobacter halimunensis TaxID=3026934 RepID=A0ABQ6FVL5_9CHLR|nr:glutathionylspermidine synthase [Dictyobacter sp. S3.2.2.5]
MVVEARVADSPHPDSRTQGQHFAEDYRNWRRAYYNRFPSFWGTLPGSTVEEYAVYGALEVPHNHVQALRLASGRLYGIMTRLATLLQQSDDQALMDIGIPSPAIPYCHIFMPAMPAVMCGRFEFAWTAQGPRLIEFNAETPTFVMELFHMNGQVCIDFGLEDPNPQCQQQLAQAIHTSIQAGLAWIEPPPRSPASVVFSAYAGRKEERGTTEFYRNLLENQGNLPYRTSFQGLAKLRVTRDRLMTVAGDPVDVLYKLYPTEHLIEDMAADGTPVGLALMDLVRRRRLAIINPPIAFILQNKALVALLWALHLSQSEIFTAEEHGWIEQYVLPTYLEALDAQGKPIFNGPYVVKPVYGREGSSITIVDQQRILEHSELNFYDKQLKVYQQYVTLPTTTLQTEHGQQGVSLVHNCFVTAGRPSAVGVRASRKLIFDDNAYFLPICYPHRESI